MTLVPYHEKALISTCLQALYSVHLNMENMAQILKTIVWHESVSDRIQAAISKADGSPILRQGENL